MFDRYKIFFILLLPFLLISCGGPSEFNPNLEINIEKNNIDINVTGSIEKIKRELGDTYMESYISKDERSIFVRKQYLGQSLLHFDITTSNPKLVDTIIESHRSDISNIYPLHNNKILYQLSTSIKIYDYKEQKVVRNYIINRGATDRTIHLSEDEKKFTVGNLTIDISAIYKNTSTLSRDHSNKIIIDSINNLVWQDDESVMANTFDFLEAVNICEQNHIYNWRVLTLQDIDTQLIQGTNLSIFQNNIDELFWLGSYEELWGYSTKEKEFHFYGNYEDFNEKYSDKDNYDGKHNYIRCVADLK